MQALFAVNLYRSLPASWLIANALFALALCFIALWIGSKYGDHLKRSSFIRRVMTDLAGRNVVEAQSFLARLSHFETD